MVRTLQQSLPLILVFAVGLVGCLPEGGGGGGSRDGGLQLDSGGSDSGPTDTDTPDDGASDTAPMPDADADADDTSDAVDADSGPMCADGEIICDGECAACPTGDGIATTGCEANACVATSCELGFRMCEEGCCVYTPPSSGSAANVGVDAAYGMIEIDVDSDGYPHVLFHVDDEPSFQVNRGEPMYAQWTGNAWSTELPGSVFAGDQVVGGSMVLDDTDTAHIGLTVGHREGFYATNGSGAWSVESLTGAQNEVRADPAVSHLGDETCLVWHQVADEKRVFCGGAGSFDDLSLREDNDIGMDLAHDTDGQLHLAVPDETALARMYAYDGTSWNGSEVFRPTSSSSYRDGEFVRVEPLAQRRLAVAFYARGNNIDDGLQVVTASVDGDDASYSIVAQTSFATMQDKLEFDLASNGDGKLALIYNSTGPLDDRDEQEAGDVYLAIGENGNWTTELVGTGGRAVSVAIGPQGIVHAVHVDGQSRIQYVVR